MPANGSLINPSYEFSWLWLILALGPLMFFSLQLNRLLFLFIPPDPHWLKSIDDWLNMDPIWLQLILYAVLPAIFEEFLFRGMLYPGFERRFGFWIAASLSAGLFAVVHLNPWQLIIAFVLGLYFAFLVKVTKSLLLPMIIHFLNNSIVLILQNLSLQALPSPEMETPGRLDTIGNTDWMLFIEISGSVFVAITLFSVCLGLYFRDSKTQ
jgi:membrane protease YdiL (CAAX protease family)